jgi:hypothetical protein
MEECFDNGKGFTFKPGGVSMLPFIEGSSDAVTIERFKGGAKKYDVVFFQREDGRYILHRVIGIKGKYLEICGDNQWNKELISEDMIFAVVSDVKRNGKNVPMTGLSYGIYCRTLFIRRFVIHVKNYIRRHFLRRGNKCDSN